MLGDPAGFWVAVLFRTFQVVAEKSVLAAQRSVGAGWALSDTPDGLVFEVADAAHGASPGAFAAMPYVRPSEDIDLGRTQLAVGRFLAAPICSCMLPIDPLARP